MPRPSPHPLTRVLAALLVLVAAFAYPLRLTPGAGGGDHARHARVEAAAPCPGHLREANLSGPTAPHPAGHEAHCLFCLTGAFALPPGPGVGVGVEFAPPATGRALAPHPAHGLPLRARARAPPHASG